LQRAALERDKHELKQAQAAIGEQGVVS
jgi:hypothetical protein